LPVFYLQGDEPIAEAADDIGQEEPIYGGRSGQPVLF
jgi:hypothetical protein